MITRENAKKLLPIIKAFSEGKQIQFRNNMNEWKEYDNFSFTEDVSRYRIKPEPKYRPFKSVDECWNEMQKHYPFGWYKYNNNYSLITHLDNNIDFKFRFKNYTFADGTPFGIKKEK